MKIQIRFIPFVLIGLSFMFMISCEKKDDNTIKDGDGNIYTPLIIGEQTWLVQNLRTTRYSNGDTISTTYPVTLDIPNDTTSKYQWFCGGSYLKTLTYGRLYTWYAVRDKRNVCPVGYHVPTNEEWTTLSTYLGGGAPDQFGRIPEIGGILKEKGTIHWYPPNQGAFDVVGFKALPGGVRDYYNMTFYLDGIWGAWWSSTQTSSETAWFRLMTYDVSDIISESGYKHNGFSVRCVKD
jgi:uncharacterized protein (TIGR02145 family)